MLYPGQWGLVPLKKAVTKKPSTSELVQEADVVVLLVVRSAGCGEQAAAVVVNGENLYFKTREHALDWRLPETEMTVGELLRRCSDTDAPSVK
jgi:hypothetical protein